MIAIRIAIMISLLSGSIDLNHSALLNKRLCFIMIITCFKRTVKKTKAWIEEIQDTKGDSALNTFP